MIVGGGECKCLPDPTKHLIFIKTSFCGHDGMCCHPTGTKFTTEPSHWCMLRSNFSFEYLKSKK